MKVKHELITYDTIEVPIKWIHHSANHSTRSIAPHWHSSLELFYMRSGTNHEIKIEGMTYETYPGMVLVVNSAEVHSIVPKYDKELDAMTFVISYELLASLIPNYTYKRFITEPSAIFSKACKKSEALSGCLEKLYFSVRSEENDLKKLEILKDTYKLIYLLVKDWMVEVDAPHFGYQIPGKGVRLHEIVSYIESHYHEDLTTSCLAETFNVSISFLQKLFKDNLDISLMAFVNSIRVQKAHHLLIHTDMPISLISSRTGFPSEKAFRLAFKSRFNETPQRYRSKNRK